LLDRLGASCKCVGERHAVTRRNTTHALSTLNTSAMTYYECTPHTGNVFGTDVMLPDRFEFRCAGTTPSRLQQCTVVGAQLASYMFLQYQYSNFFSLRLPFSFPILFLVYAVFLIGLLSSCLKFFFMFHF